MSRKTLRTLFMTLVVSALALTATSCKDDDKDEHSSTPTEAEVEQQMAAEEAFLSVVGQLTDGLQLPDDWQNATFEPAYGMADEANPYVRIRVVNSADGAAKLYGYLVGDPSIDGTTATHTYHHDAVGTLTYTRSADGQSLATVDVDIPQMPHLQKIVYKTPSQLGANTIWNGNFDGSAYYRFGDVIHRAVTNGQDEYWVCVRPAFSPEGKGDTHWITLSALQDDNIFHYEGSNGQNYYLPTKLGDYPKYELCFAEVLSAILNPDLWQRNLQQNADLDFFNDFDPDLSDCHNKGFWRMVATAWDEENIFAHVFPGFTRQTVQDDVNTRGLHLLYSGYSWKTTFSWKASLYERIYTGLNLTTVTKQTHTKDMRDLTLDMSGRYYANRSGNSAFFGDNKPRWVIRHATGKELGGHDDPKRPIEGFDETYLFNKRFVADKNLADDDLVIVEPTTKVNGYFIPGDVVVDANGVRWICVQAAFKTDNDQLYDHVPYSYFISTDPRAIRTDDDDFGNLPSRNMAFQIMHQLVTLYSNWLGDQSMNSQRGYIMASYTQRGGLMLDQLVPFHTYQSADHHNEWVKVYIMNAMYKDLQGKNGIARFVYDLDAIEPVHGGRDMQFRCYDMYLVGDDVDDRRMYVSDLYDQAMVNLYSQETAKWSDKTWCVPPYRTDATMELRPATRRGSAITETDMTGWYYLRDSYILTEMSETKSGLNMYLEPVFTFAVKRIRDTGIPVWNFDNDLRFAISYKQPAGIFDSYQDHAVVGHKQAAQAAIFINDLLEDFGVSNER